MGLKQNLQDIQTNLANAKTKIAQSITNKGVECSADEALSTYSTKIDNITGGGSGKYVVPNGMKFAYSSSIDMENLDFSNVTDMSYMFYNCIFSSIDLSNFDTSNVTNMSRMFNDCSRLTSLDVSSFNTTSVTNMYYMFNNCSKLTSLDISNFNTNKVTDMTFMFYGCSNLTSIDVSSFNTTSVTVMYYMFNNCSKLISLDLSNFDTSKVTDMNRMFYGCSELISLDLSNFDTSKVTDMNRMFYDCSELTDLQFNDLGHNESCKEIDLTFCSKLSKESVLFLFNNAFDRQSAGYTTPFNIKLHATTKALLSEEEIAIATNKGFTVV